MNSNKLVINLVVLVKVLADSQDLKDSMINLDSRDNNREDSSHLGIFLMNSRNSLVEPKEVKEVQVHEVANLDKEAKIL